MVAVDVDEAALTDVAQGKGQEPGRVHGAVLGDEDDPVAIADAEPAADAAGLDLLLGQALVAHAADSHAPVVHRLGGLDLEGRLLGEVVQPAHQPLGIHRRHLRQGGATAHRDQEEQAPPEQLLGAQQLVHRGQVAAVTSVTSVFTCTGRPSSAAQSRAVIVRSNVPGTPRSPSWRTGSDPSRLREIAWIPAPAPRPGARTSGRGSLPVPATCRSHDPRRPGSAGPGRADAGDRPR